AIHYVAHRFNAENNFYFVGLHGFSFPLLSTLERFLDMPFGVEKDLYLRSITGYYGLLILMLVFHVLQRFNFLLGFIAAICLFLTSGFFITVREFHIDTYRIFFSVFAILAYIRISNERNYFYLTIIGMLFGIAAFIHSISVFICFAFLLAFFAFSRERINIKILYSIYLFITMIVFGLLHYILDVTMGTGWLLQTIKFY
ncbi:MAG: glycosyltransferase family 39 protein, partial [Flavobacteriales bacterium]|nr:glycosyltransferase family 39 protein [Flavobacteriales bacterium]